MLSFSELASLCEEVNDRLQGLRLISVKESSEEKWILDFEKREQLLVCLRSPYARMHLLKKKFHRSSTHFSQALENVLKDARVEKIYTVSNDRVIRMDFSRDKRVLFLEFELFSRHPNQLRVLSDKGLMLLTYRKEEKVSPPIAKEPTQFPLCCRSVWVENAFAYLEQNDSFEHAKRHLQVKVAKKLSKLQKLCRIYQEELSKGEGWKQLEHEGKLLQSNLFRVKKGISSIEIEDWEEGGKLITLILDPLKSPSENTQAKFRVAKKLKTKALRAAQLLEKSQEEREIWQGLLLQAQSIATLEELQAFEEELFPKKPKVLSANRKEVPFRHYRSMAGLSIFVGHNAKENTELTFQFARGNDLWLHAADCGGAHVIVRGRKELAIDEQTLNEARQLAVFYSQAKERGQAEVISALRKHLRRGKKLGQVLYSKHSKAFVQLDPKSVQSVLSRTIS